MKKVLLSLLVGLAVNGYCHATNRITVESFFDDFTGTAELSTMECDSCTASDFTASSATFLSGVANIPFAHIDIPAKDQDIILSDTVGISSTTLAAGGTTYVTADLTQPGVPRNIVIIATNGAGSLGQSTLTITSGQCYVSGINSVGISTNEYVNLVSTSDATAGRGNIAWNSISSVTISNIVFARTPNGTLYINIGTSDKIGLCNSLDAVGDVIKIVEAGIDHSTTTAQTINAVYNTYTPLIAPDGSTDYLTVQNVKKTPRR